MGLLGNKMCTTRLMCVRTRVRTCTCVYVRAHVYIFTNPTSTELDNTEHSLYTEPSFHFWFLTIAPPLPSWGGILAAYRTLPGSKRSHPFCLTSTHGRWANADGPWRRNYVMAAQCRWLVNALLFSGSCSLTQTTHEHTHTHAHTTARTHARNFAPLFSLTLFHPFK